MAGERPRFSEMLVERRRQLGLSITQAANVLRLKEQVLLAFEEGNFELMPKSGYAQGMLSSYARYLGLNANQIAAQYVADLRAYNRSMESMRRSVASDEVPRGGVGMPTARYQGARGLLPSSGGLAGDMGAFATTTAVRRVGSGTGGVDGHDGVHGGGGYGAMGQGYSGQGAYVGMQDSVPGSSHDAETYGEHRYTTRNPSAASTVRHARRMQGQQRGRRDEGISREGVSHGDGYRFGREQVTTRRVNHGQYVDDLRYDVVASPFEAASTMSGRRGSRDIASTRRPNVQRQTRPRRPRPPQRGGIWGVIDAFLSDPRRTLLLIVAISALVLTVVLVTSVRSCIANQSSTGRTVEVTKADTPALGSDAQDDDDDTSAADAEALADAAASRKQESVPEKTVVKVEVADGMVSWVDIQADDVAVIADTVTGPWEQEFTVSDSITIEVGDTSSVTVTENGEVRQFDARTSGIGTITIRSAAKAAEEEAASGTDTDTQATDDGGSGQASGAASSPSASSDA